MRQHYDYRFPQRGAVFVNVLLFLIIVILAVGGWYGGQFFKGLSTENRNLKANIEALNSSRQESVEAVTLSAALLSDRLDQVDVELAVRAEAFAAMKTGGQRNWLLNEAEALASLGQQRLLLTADVAAAQRLLQAADQTLARAGDPLVLPARKALASDIEKLRGAQQIDVQALVLQLGALQQVVNSLALPVSAADQSAQVKAPPEEGAGWWEQLLYTLPVTVRRQASPLPLPLDEQQASALRLYLDNALQQAQLSLLQSKAASFRQSIGLARAAVGSWLNPQDSNVKHLDESLQLLEQIDVEQALPEIGEGLSVIRGLRAEAVQ